MQDAIQFANSTKRRLRKLARQEKMTLTSPIDPISFAKLQGTRTPLVQLTKVKRQNKTPNSTMAVGTGDDSIDFESQVDQLKGKSPKHRVSGARRPCTARQFLEMCSLTTGAQDLSYLWRFSRNTRIS